MRSPDCHLRSQSDKKKICKPATPISSSSNARVEFVAAGFLLFRVENV